ncbi:MAG: hypothetical protein JXQ72_10925 [Anaerolineae bacterium]|nr:hypothetical protein [Anaerolineae bacterium]
MSNLSILTDDILQQSLLPASALSKLRQDERYEKLARIRALLDRQNLDALWLTRWSNIAWLTSAVSSLDDKPRFLCQSGVLITRDATYLLVDKWHDNHPLTPLGVYLAAETHFYNGQEPGAFKNLVGRLADSAAVGSDGGRGEFKPIHHELARLHLELTAIEQYEYRALCRDGTSLLQSVAHGIMPGQSEQEIAAEIASRCYHSGIQPTRLLVSADSGIRRYRHPLPGDTPVSKFVILVLEGVRTGLPVTLTRMVAVDRLPVYLEQKYRTAAYLSVLCAHYMRPGGTIAEGIKTGKAAFHAQVPPRKWHVFFKSDILTCRSCDIGARTSGDQPIDINQVLVWATGVSGIRSEDTYLILPDCNELLTHTDNWPVIEIHLNDQTYYHPDILRL